MPPPPTLDRRRPPQTLVCGAVEIVCQRLQLPDAEPDIIFVGPFVGVIYRARHLKSNDSPCSGCMPIPTYEDSEIFGLFRHSSGLASNTIDVQYQACASGKTRDGYLVRVARLDQTGLRSPRRAMDEPIGCRASQPVRRRASDNPLVERPRRSEYADARRADGPTTSTSLAGCPLPSHSFPAPLWYQIP